MEDKNIITVSQLNKYINAMFAADDVLSAVSVSGEISNFKPHSSGHLYFTIKDDFAKISCVMFRNAAMRLDFVPEDGLHVVVMGYVGVYEKTGTYQLYASVIQKQGAGLLYEKYNALLAELQDKGYFDDSRKKGIPFLPKSIALVTSPTGAAVRDMISVITRRCPICKLIVCPVPVQGSGASKEIAAMIDYINEQHLAELIITGRGGGSIEELWAFNERAVAESVFRSQLPVISAVGHETDFTVCDFVADMRAPTPSAAAELAVPDIRDMVFTLNKYVSSLKERLILAVNNRRSRLDLLCKTRVFSDPMLAVENRRMYTNALANKLNDGAERIVVSAREKLENKKQLLDSLSYENVLRRGYCVLAREGRFVKDAEIRAGEGAEIITAQKILRATIEEVSERGRVNGDI